MNTGTGAEFVTSDDTWLMMVGRNNENAYRGAVIPANISTGKEDRSIKEVRKRGLSPPVRQVFRSDKLCQIYFILNFSPAALYWSSPCNRRITTVRSALVRNFALSGKSWMIQKDMNPATIVAKPSKMKIHAQPGFPPTPCIFEIAAFWNAELRGILEKGGSTYSEQTTKCT